MRVVSPYRPFPPVSVSHQHLGAFDWPGALAMLRDSVTISNGCATFALTDLETELPIPSFRFPTTEDRLMLWILEVSLAYLESDEFNQDTVFVSPDVLVFGDLRLYFKGDLTILVRTGAKYHLRPVINVMQWWPVKARPELIAFYRAALAVAGQLPDDIQTWGADSESIRVLLDPIGSGLHERSGCRVSMIECTPVLRPLNASEMQAIDQGQKFPRPLAPAIDFKGSTRKPYMARYWAAVNP